MLNVKSSLFDAEEVIKVYLTFMKWEIKMEKQGGDDYCQALVQVRVQALVQTGPQNE